MKKNGFTLIELIAVLVILAILALIVTPLVMNIIKKARISADKRSVDAYGRSVELAIANYLLDNGDFPTSIEQLTIEYTGDEVVCSTTQINTDSSVYLAGCTVGGRDVDYTYGNDKSPSYTAYKIGDEVTYNNINYYVIKDSGIKESTVTLLKAEPLTVDEVNQYGTGHVNRYTSNSVGTAYNSGGYGGMQYYSSSTCGYNGTNWVSDGCKNDYVSSEVKYVVDAWASAQASAASDARLITLEDLKSLGYSDDSCIQSGSCSKSAEVPSWLHVNSLYWTSSPSEGSSSYFWGVGSSELSASRHVYTVYGVVRPVIVLPKSVLN